MERQLIRSETDFKAFELCKIMFSFCTDLICLKNLAIFLEKLENLFEVHIKSSLFWSLIFILKAKWIMFEIVQQKLCNFCDFTRRIVLALID